MTEITTFILWKWVGWRGEIYTANTINTFCKMLRANLKDLPHNIICITDDPTGITECETYPLWAEWPNLMSVGKPNCFRRLRLFHSEFSKTLGSRLVSIDVDCVIRGDISHLFYDDVPFKILQGKHSRYTGSLWMLRPGVHEHVWTDFHPVKAPQEIIEARKQTKYAKLKLVGSDQAWMSLKIDNAAIWPIGSNQEIISYRLDLLQPENRVPPQSKIVVFAGGVKPWDTQCRDRTPSLYATWMSYQK